MLKSVRIKIPEEQLAAFCERWQIKELALFGSVLRSDFRPDSDVDFLVTYAPDKKFAAWYAFPEQEEMEDLLQRKTDWVLRDALEQSANYLRRREILASAEVIYAS